MAVDVQVSPLALTASMVLAVAALASVRVMPRLVGAFAPFEGEAARRPVPSTRTFAAVTVLAVGAVALALHHRPSWLPAYLYLTVVGVVLAAVDLRVHRLPDALVLPSYPILAALFGLAAVLDGLTADTWDGGHAAGAAMGAGLLLAAFGLLYLIPGGGLGLGDVKLVGLLGASLGWLGSLELVLLGLLAGLLSAGAYAGFLLATRRAGRSDPIAYGPHLLLGAFLAILVGAVGV
ncbi:prepilin peptidase [Frankia sp. CNm7]|uniref:Prepilin peptidase n=1 Tax=Frankia nepalensis TaxID=1836974 RepID=A0A937RHK4_9ACTN|nr:prepilin peptidase [Frankia nepalensis]MBL7502206.1 prepilin peptidase [Frankia nepalensis]MBL7513479.1 prepilin peptidase [Frankia nepalensis]MBL7522635.1 prepilin peptidase [Frankia nepalensis]MBL7630337.1 prepilin peptidase [Frankia nepalensis]